MPQETFADWSATSSNNSTVEGDATDGSVNIAEACLPGNVNNGLRAIMAACNLAFGDLPSGTSRPSYLTSGRFWKDTTTAASPVIKFYDGTDDITVFTVDTTNNTVSFSGALTDGDKGDITVSGSGSTWTIDNGVVTYAKIQDVSATSRLIGRITAGAGDQEELTGTQATTLLDTFTSALKGLAPASGGGTTNFLRADGSWADPGGGITRGTAVATTSGTAQGFTGLPSGIDRITLMFDGVSTNGTSDLLVQIGDSGGYETSGYDSDITFLGATGNNTNAQTAGFQVTSDHDASDTWTGTVVLSRMDGDKWVATVSLNPGGRAVIGQGIKTLSGTLDRIQLTTVGGTDTFDAGSINILYE